MLFRVLGEFFAQFLLLPFRERRVITLLLSGDALQIRKHEQTDNVAVVKAEVCDCNRRRLKCNTLIPGISHTVPTLASKAVYRSPSFLKYSAGSVAALFHLSSAFTFVSS